MNQNIIVFIYQLSQCLNYLPRPHGLTETVEEATKKIIFL